MPQFENRQNVQLTCHTRDEGEDETKTRTKSKKSRDHDAEEDVVVYDFTRGTVRQQLVGLQGGSLFDLLGEGRYINRDTEMAKGLNRLKVASLCDDDSATKVQRNKQLDDAAGLRVLLLANLPSFTLLIHAMTVPSSNSFCTSIHCEPIPPR